MSEDKIKILVDLDNVIANWDLGVLEKLRNKCPDYPFIPIEERNIRDIYEQYRRKFGEGIIRILQEIHREKGFYRNLKLMRGAKEALEELSKHFNVIICGEVPHNAPEEVKRRIIQEKTDWIRENLGDKWAQEAILIPFDKSEIEADYLIDDTPNKGNGNQKWEQILFKWPYNQNSMKNTLRIDWSECELIVEKILSDIRS